MAGKLVFPFLAGSYLLLAWLTWRVSLKIGGPDFSSLPGERLVEYSQGFGGTGNAYQRILKRGDVFAVDYGFRNFNRDELEIHVQLPKRDVDVSFQEYGFRARDLKALDDWYQRAQQGAIDRSKLLYAEGKITGRTQAEVDRKMAEANARNASIQAALDKTLAELAAEYKQKRLKLYADAGFHYRDARTVEVDIPAVARRNAARMGPVSLAFAEIAQQKSYGMEDLVGAVTAMAQTAIRYEEMPDVLGDKSIAALLPPPKIFASGQGNCGSKSAVIGSVLLNWPNLKLVGLAIPGHYLLAVHRIPERGEVYIEYRGDPYVMIEAAGPAWLPPGAVGEHTQEYLSSGRQFAIQPFTL